MDQAYRIKQKGNNFVYSFIVEHSRMDSGIISI